MSEVPAAGRSWSGVGRTICSSSLKCSSTDGSRRPLRGCMIHPSIYLFLYLSIYLSIYLYVYIWIILVTMKEMCRAKLVRSREDNLQQLSSSRGSGGSYPQALQAAKQWLRLGGDVRHRHQAMLGVCDPVATPQGEAGQESGGQSAAAH